MQRMRRRAGDRAVLHLWRSSNRRAQSASNFRGPAVDELLVCRAGRCGGGRGAAGVLSGSLRLSSSTCPELNLGAGGFGKRLAVPSQNRAANGCAIFAGVVASKSLDSRLKSLDPRLARLSLCRNWTANVLRLHTDVDGGRLAAVAAADEGRRDEPHETEFPSEKAREESAASTALPRESTAKLMASSHGSAPEKDGDNSPVSNGHREGLEKSDIGEQQGMSVPVQGHELQRLPPSHDASYVQKLTTAEADELRRRASAQAAAILWAALDEDDKEDKKVEVEFQRSLTVGIVGAPNAGKSLLTNKLVGSRVSAVSRKTNTTHREHMAAYTKGDTQLLYYDTPGLHLDVEGYPLRVEAKNRVRNAWEIADFCEALVVLVDAERQIRKPDKRVQRLVDKLGKEQIAGQKRVLCLNKVDIIEPKRQLLPLAKQCEDLVAYDRIFMISGLTGSGLNDVRDYLLDQSVLRPWDEDPDLTNHRDIALEIVREQIFERLHEELPHTTKQKLVSWKVLKDGSIRIQQQLLVAKKEHQKILVGKNGAVIGEIGIKARKELQQILGATVHLILDVLIQPNGMVHCDV